MPKLGIQGLKNPQSPSPNPHLFQHLPHFTLQNHKIALSRVSRQPPPRCSRGRGGGLEFTVICTGFAGWWIVTMGRDGSTYCKGWQHQNQEKEESSTMARDGSTSMGMVATRGRELHPLARNSSTLMGMVATRGRELHLWQVIAAPR